MKFIYGLLFAIPLSLYSQTKVKTRQHSIGLSLGTSINNFTERQPLWLQESMMSAFYKYNRYAVSLGVACMKNPARVVDLPRYLYGPAVSLSGDIIALKRIRIPVLLYMNYYEQRYSEYTGMTTTVSYSFKGAKLGIEYTPFRFPLTVYAYGGINTSFGSRHTEESAWSVYSTGHTRPVGTIDIGLKYAVFRKGMVEQPK